MEADLDETPTWVYVVVTFSVVLTLAVLSKSQERRKRRQEERPVSKRVPEYSWRHPPSYRRIFSANELAYYGGIHETVPLYIGCKGRVYDVSSSEDFYGPGGGYAHFTGKDASRALARMDIKEKSESLEGLTRAELQTLDEWTQRFNEKYPVVGTLQSWVDGSHAGRIDMSEPVEVGPGFHRDPSQDRATRGVKTVTAAQAKKLQAKADAERLAQQGPQQGQQLPQQEQQPTEEQAQAQAPIPPVGSATLAAAFAGDDESKGAAER